MNLLAAGSKKFRICRPGISCGGQQLGLTGKQKTLDLNK
jgi:hypothetical protein